MFTTTSQADIERAPARVGPLRSSAFATPARKRRLTMLPAALTLGGLGAACVTTAAMGAIVANSQPVQLTPQTGVAFGVVGSILLVGAGLVWKAAGWNAEVKALREWKDASEVHQDRCDHDREDMRTDIARMKVALRNHLPPREPSILDS